MKKLIPYILFSMAAFLLMEFSWDLSKPIANAIPETEHLIGTLQTRNIVKSLWCLVEVTTFFIFAIANGYLFAHFFTYYCVWYERKEKEIRAAMKKSDPK